MDIKHYILKAPYEGMEFLSDQLDRLLVQMLDLFGVNETHIISSSHLDLTEEFIQFAATTLGISSAAFLTLLLFRFISRRVFHDQCLSKNIAVPEQRAATGENNSDKNDLLTLCAKHKLERMDFLNLKAHELRNFENESELEKFYCWRQSLSHTNTRADSELDDSDDAAEDHEPEEYCMAAINHLSDGLSMAKNQLSDHYSIATNQICDGYAMGTNQICDGYAVGTNQIYDGYCTATNNMPDGYSMATRNHVVGQANFPENPTSEKEKDIFDKFYRSHLFLPPFVKHHISVEKYTETKLATLEADKLNLDIQYTTESLTFRKLIRLLDQDIVPIDVSPQRVTEIVVNNRRQSNDEILDILCSIYELCIKNKIAEWSLHFRKSVQPYFRNRHFRKQFQTRPVNDLLQDIQTYYNSQT